MATFFYQATDREGRFIEGDVEAANFRLAVDKVRKLNYYPIQVAPERPKASLGRELRVPGLEWFQRVPQREVLAFTQQLATLLASGLTLDKSLSIIVKLTRHPRAREVFGEVHKKVHAGSTFADALSGFPEVFSRLYISMVRAGEVGGVLNSVLERLSVFMESWQDMKNRVLTSLFYPIILVLVGGAAVVFLITFVVPKFQTIFADMEDRLPWITRLLLEVSNVVSGYWWAVLVLGVAGAAGIFYFIRSERGKAHWDAFLMRLPLVGDLIRKIEVSRFARTMATLQKSGVPVLQALHIVRSIVNNTLIARSMNELHDALKSGQGMSRPLQRSGVFPPLAVHMIVVGEETGRLDDMLVKVADTFDKEVDTALKRMISLIGPVLILVLGLCVLMIVLSVLWGIISVNDLAF